MKQRKKRFLAAALACVILSSVSSGLCSVQAAEKEEIAEQDCIVMVDNVADYEKLAEKYGAEEAPQTVKEDGMLFLSLTEEEKAALEQKDGIHVEEDVALKASGESSLQEVSEDAIISIDPEDQWNLNMISAVDVGGDITSENLAKIKVAVLDSGVSFTTDVDIEKSINLVPGEEEVLPFYEDVTGHGTSVASIIGALDNNEGTTGVNPSATLYSVRVLDDNNEAPVSRVIEGIYWCIENDVNIINMSFGMNSYNEALHTAIKAADDAGILMIAAAGNGNQVQYPAAFSEVMAVGGINSEGQALYQNADDDALDITAPGKAVPTAGFLNDVIEAEGTSMSAPHVTGAASILWAKNPDQSATFIRNLLQETAKENTATKSDVGVLDLGYAIEIYEEAEQNADIEGNVIVPTNEGDLQIFDEDTVNALWSPEDHASAIDNRYEGDMVKFVRYGIKSADRSSVIKNNNSNVESDCFHGFSNYVSNTVYLAQIAKETERLGSMTDAIKNVAYPVENSSYLTASGNVKSKNQIQNVLKKFNTTEKWNEVLANKKVIGNDSVLTTSDLTSTRKAYFILGLSVHVAMDTFAHKARIYKNGEWVSVKSVSSTNSGDSVDEYPNRYNVAVKVAQTILNRYCGKSNSNSSIDASVFYKPNYYPTPKTNDSDSFKLEAFNTYYNYCSTTLYQQQKSWIDARSVTTN